MIELITIFKKQASGVGEELRKDSKVIEAIDQKQDHVLSELDR